MKEPAMTNRIRLLLTSSALLGALSVTCGASARDRELPAATGGVAIASHGVFQLLAGELSLDALFNPRAPWLARAARAEPPLELVPTLSSGNYGLSAVCHF
jgi:hypothetical protein